jgi:hypothetical protein
VETTEVKNDSVADDQRANGIVTIGGRRSRQWLLGKGEQASRESGVRAVSARSDHSYQRPTDHQTHVRHFRSTDGADIFNPLLVLPICHLGEARNFRD